MTPFSSLRTRRKRGFGLVDALVGLFILAIGALSITALMPSFSRSQHMSDEMSKAAQIASRQIEQLRTVGYPNLNYPTLRGLNLVDEWDGEGPMTFTLTNAALNLSPEASLPNGAGEVVVTDVTQDVREVLVRVNWTSRGGASRTVQLATLIGADG